MSVADVHHLVISHSNFESNKCFVNGGALFLSISSDLNSVIEDSTFIDNTAITNSGGAVFFMVTSNLMFNRLLFRGNVATNSGGALAMRLTDNPIVINYCTFTRNRAIMGDGSAIDVGDGQSFISVYYSTFQENSALMGTLYYYFHYYCIQDRILNIAMCLFPCVYCCRWRDGILDILLR
jgi:predicted outer membrane repeat protein